MVSNVMLEREGQELQRARLAAEFARFTFHAVDVEACVREAVRYAGSGLAAEAAFLELLPGTTVVRVASPEAEEKTGAFADSAGTIAQAAREKEAPILVSDWAHERRFQPLPFWTPDEHACGLYVAIYGRTRPYGILCAHAAQSNTFDASATLFLHQLALTLSTAIQRLQAEDDLQDAEERFHLMVEGIEEYAIVMLDEQGYVLNWNAGARRMTGYSEEEIVGQNQEIFYTPEDRASGVPQHALEVATLRGQYTASGWRLRGNGMRYWADVVITALRDRDDHIVGFSIITRDVTERRRMEERLRLLEAAVHNMRESVVITDSRLRPPGPRILFANPGFEHMTGYDIEDVLGESPQLLHGPATDPATLQNMVDQIAAGHDWHGEAVNYRKNGEPFHVEWSVSPVKNVQGDVSHFVVVQRDVSQRKQAQEDLQRLATHLSLLREIDTALLQATSSEEIARAVSTSIRQLIPCDYAAIHLIGQDESLTTSAPPPSLEHTTMESLIVVPIRMSGSDLGELVVAAHGAETFTEDDRLAATEIANRLALALHSIDLRERLIHSKEQLTRLSRQLLTVQERERRYVARELHDEIGQSLTALKISLNVRRRGDNPSFDAGEVEEVVEEVIGRVRRLSRELRPAALDDLGLETALRSLCERFSEQTGIHIGFEVAGTLIRHAPEIEMAIYRISQEALTNVARHARTDRACVRLTEEDGRLQLTISDNGCGFNVTAAPAGVGLSGMHERVTLLNGALSIRSAPGAGTTIAVNLPSE